MNSYDPPQPDSPPSAHPASQQPSLSSWPPPPRPPRQSSSRRNATETLYWGSAAPASLNSRRSAPRKGTSYHPSTTSPPPQVPRGTFSPVLLTEGTCCCCATRVKYPRASGTFRCVTCDTVVDLNEEQRRGKSSEAVPQHEATPVSEEQWLALLSRLQARAEESDEELALRLTALELSGTATGVEEEDYVPEDVLVAYLITAFSNLSSIEASFRPSSPSSSSSSSSTATKPLPRHTTLTAVYDLLRTRPTAMEILRGMVEALLKRPGPTLLDSDGGWLIVLFESPILRPAGTPDSEQRRWMLSRFIGLLSTLPNTVHHRLVTYLSSTPSTSPSSSTPSPPSTALSYPLHLLQDKLELVCGFLSWRIGLAASESREDHGEKVDYRTDWRVKAGARVTSLLFNANLTHPSSSRLPLSAFYVTLIDSLGSTALIEDFTSWESGSGAEEDKLSLCQYPFLMSLGVKVGLLGWDGERQMMARAREAYRSSFATNELESPLLLLRIRREHIVSDSLRQISLNRENLKKTLRIAFEGEEGVDAGGLRKEWFLSLCRQLFDPRYGMFVTDPDSNLSWFNPASLNDTDDFWLVGVVLGLALYNTATLDIPLPLAIYQLLLSEPVTLSSLSQLQPALAKGLQQLLDFEPADEVEDTFLRTFVGEYEAWGETQSVELVEGGAEVAVTGENRADYVRLLTNFHLSTSVSPQLDAFAQGFHEVCAGNALALFKADELELVVRGSAEPLEVDQLKLLTVYEGLDGPEGRKTIELFWLVFTSFSPSDQRLLLAFITASDRLPATGTSSLQLKLQSLGADCDRLPISHTCFNTLAIWRYGTGEKMERMLRRAMEESEGFGLR